MAVLVGVSGGEERKSAFGQGLSILSATSYLSWFIVGAKLLRKAPWSLVNECCRKHCPVMRLASLWLCRRHDARTHGDLYCNDDWTRGDLTVACLSSSLWAVCINSSELPLTSFLSPSTPYFVIPMFIKPHFFFFKWKAPLSINNPMVHCQVLVIWAPCPPLSPQLGCLGSFWLRLCVLNVGAFPKILLFCFLNLVFLGCLALFSSSPFGIKGCSYL